jgi:small subunit ribosomal protein S3Ae
MAVKPKKGKAVDKWRKKRYFSVLAPKIFQEREIGQTIAYDASSLNGRPINTNLMVITGNIKKQQINITFKINKVQGDTAYTMVEQYAVSPSAIKRKIRRQRERVDESLQCVTKDNKIVRIKPLLITRVKASRSVLSVLRNALLRFVLDSVRKTDYDSLVMDIINEKFQKNVANTLSKIAPVRFVDIRMMKYLGEQEAAVEAPTEEKVEEKVEEKPEPEKPKKKKAVKKQKPEEVEKTAPEAKEEELEETAKPEETAKKPEEKTELAEEAKPTEA